jgi:hypothetical protein
MNSTAVDRVLDKLIQARLVRLTTSASLEDEQIELTHEALIHSWPRYQMWLEEEELKRYRHWRLAKDAQEWALQGDSPELLLRGERLEEAKTYENLNELEHKFLRASETSIAELKIREEHQIMQLKLLEDELKTVKSQAESQGLELRLLQNELQAARQREASQIAQLKELETTAANALAQKKRSHRYLVLTIFCLIVAIATTAITVSVSQRSVQRETLKQ